MSFNKSEAVRNAEKFLAQGKIRQAVNEYQEIVKRDPDDITNLNILGDLLVKANQTNEALKCFCRVAEHYSQKGFPQKAIAVYNKIFKYKPDCTDTLERLAELNRSKGAVAEARIQYRKLAEFFEKKGETAKLISAWKSLSELDKQNSDICLKLGELCRTHSKPKDAADAFAEAGDRLFAKNDLDKSLEAYSTALEEESEHVKGFQGYVRIALIRGTYVDAVDKLENILNDQPENADLRELLAECYLEMGEVFKAEDILMGLVTGDSSRHRHLLRILKMHLTSGEVKSAMRILSMTADHLLSGAEPERLLEWTDAVLERDPANLDAMRLQARFHTSKGDVLAATAILDQISVMALKSVEESAPSFNNTSSFEISALDSQPSIEIDSKELDMFDAGSMPDYSYENQSDEMDSTIFGEKGIEAFTDADAIGGTAREFIEEESAREFSEEVPGEGDDGWSTQTAESFVSEELSEEASARAFDESEYSAPGNELETDEASARMDSIVAAPVDGEALPANQEQETLWESTELGADDFDGQSGTGLHGFEILAITHETVGGRAVAQQDEDIDDSESEESATLGFPEDESEVEVAYESIDDESPTVYADPMGDPAAFESASEANKEGSEPTVETSEVGSAGDEQSFEDFKVDFDCSIEHCLTAGEGADSDFVEEAAPDADAVEFHQDAVEAAGESFDDRTEPSPAINEFESDSVDASSDMIDESAVATDSESEEDAYPEISLYDAAPSVQFESTSYSFDVAVEPARLSDEIEFNGLAAEDVEPESFVSEPVDQMTSDSAEAAFVAGQAVEFEPTSFEPESAVSELPRIEGLEINGQVFAPEYSEPAPASVEEPMSGSSDSSAPDFEATVATFPNFEEISDETAIDTSESVESSEPKVARNFSFETFVSDCVSESVHVADELTESSAAAGEAANPYAPHIEFDFDGFSDVEEPAVAIEVEHPSESVDVEEPDFATEMTSLELAANPEESCFAVEVAPAEEPVDVEESDFATEMTNFEAAANPEESCFAVEAAPAEEPVDVEESGFAVEMVDFEFDQESQTEGPVTLVSESAAEVSQEQFSPKIDFDFSAFEEEAVRIQAQVEDFVEAGPETAPLDDFGPFGLNSENFAQESHANGISNGYSNGSNGHLNGSAADADHSFIDVSVEVPSEDDVEDPLLFTDDVEGSTDGLASDLLVETAMPPTFEYDPATGFVEVEESFNQVEQEFVPEAAEPPEAVTAELPAPEAFIASEDGEEISGDGDARFSITTDSFEARIDQLVAEMNLNFASDLSVEEAVTEAVAPDGAPEENMLDEGSILERMDHTGAEYAALGVECGQAEPEVPAELAVSCEPDEFFELPPHEEVLYPRPTMASVETETVKVQAEDVIEDEVSDVQARENRLASLIDSVDFFINEGFFEVAKKNFDAVVAEFGHRPQFAELEERLALFTAHYAAEEPSMPSVNTNASLLSVSPEPYDPDFPELSTLGMYTPEEIKNMVQVVEIDEDLIFDYETFYDTATAYREMGLLDYAIREFENALRLVRPDDGTRRFFQCCNMLGHCFMDFGKPDLAVMWFRRAQEVPDLSSDEDLALLYEIAKALEAHGKTAEAANLIGQLSVASNGFGEVNDIFRRLTQS